MTTSSPELSEMADIFPSESWTDSQLETGTALRPHAQAHLLSSTENCKVGPRPGPDLASLAERLGPLQGYLSNTELGQTQT